MLELGEGNTGFPLRRFWSSAGATMQTAAAFGPQGRLLATITGSRLGIASGVIGEGLPWGFVRGH